MAHVRPPDEGRLELLVLHGDDSWTVALPRTGSLSIGRGEGCAVRIHDPFISRCHALLHVGSALVIEDLGGANGTTICERTSGAQIEDTLSARRIASRNAELSVGDSLLFGEARVVVRRTPADAGESRGDTRDLAGAGLRDPAMQDLLAQAELVAASSLPVLIFGETGVGKEVLARAIHGWSPRATNAFHAVNCATLADSLLASELFGHEKGAFTGALAARLGLFEAASGGTLLLDEIGELPLQTQAKLLRVLEQGAIVRLGGSRPHPIDVRFIAATHCDIEADCAAGRFRQDLYFRLNGVSLAIPPLRARPIEIEGLAREFLSTACRQLGRVAVPSLSAAALACLRAHAWPGNVRELRRAMERAAVFCRGPAVGREHLPTTIASACTAPRSDMPAHGAASELDGAGLRSEIRSLERERIIEALRRTGGVQTEAAKLLAMPRRTLIARIEAYGLPRPRKQDDSEA